MKQPQAKPDRHPFSDDRNNNTTVEKEGNFVKKAAAVIAPSTVVGATPLQHQKLRGTNRVLSVLVDTTQLSKAIERSFYYYL